MDQIWTNLFLAWGVQTGSLLSPGPGVLFLLSVATMRGRVHALAATIGIGGATVVWSTAAVVGLSAILSEASQVLYFMKFLAAGYLGWLAWKSFRSAVNPKTFLIERESNGGGLVNSAVAGFVMQVSNPKTILFWLAITSLGATADGPGWVPVVFILVAVSLSLLIHAIWALAFSTKAVVSAYKYAQRWVDATLGILFSATAVRLVISNEA